MSPDRLPVHGFVLAGGKSSRMGKDKAVLKFRGRPMVEIAVEKLRSFCAEVSIVGEREDLAAVAPVVHGEREGIGPAAGIEAGLGACASEWALFVPVDVPLVPAELLRGWVEGFPGAEESSGQYLVAGGCAQPTFCLLPRAALTAWTEGIQAGERRLDSLLERTGACGWPVEELRAVTSGPAQVRAWFQNVNTPEDLRQAERAAD